MTLCKETDSDTMKGDLDHPDRQILSSSDSFFSSSSFCSSEKAHAPGSALVGFFQEQSTLYSWRVLQNSLQHIFLCCAWETRVICQIWERNVLVNHVSHGLYVTGQSFHLSDWGWMDLHHPFDHSKQTFEDCNREIIVAHFRLSQRHPVLFCQMTLS